MGWWLVFLLVKLSCGIDLLEAEHHLMNAYASYCTPGPLLSWNCYWCNETKVKVMFIISNTTTDINGYVGIDLNRNNVVVSFRGSRRESISNWIENFEFYREAPYPELPEVLVHEGFWGAYTSIKGQLVVAIRETIKICNHCQEITYVGHSLGAAIVALAAVDLLYQGDLKNVTVPSTLVTFGQPRIGNLEWSTLYENWMNCSYRLVHDRDPVPHMPPESWGFHHFPFEVWEYVERTFKNCSITGEDDTCSDSMYVLYLDDHFVYLGFDHRKASPFSC